MVNLLAGGPGTAFYDDSFKADESGFGKNRWTVDEGGFAKARVAALDEANFKLLAAVHNQNASVIRANHPSSVAASIDGRELSSASQLDEAIK